MNLPLALVLVRAAATVPVAFFILQGDAVAALVVFSIAALTDAIDGRLARARGQVTRAGEILDPLADKALLLGTLGTLVTVGVAPAWAFFLIAMREVAVTAFRAAGAPGQASDTLDRLKTVFQLTAVAGLLALPGTGAASAVLAAAVSLTLVTGARHAASASGWGMARA